MWLRKVLSLIISISGFLLPGTNFYGAEGDVVVAGPTRHSLTADIDTSDGKSSFSVAWRIRREAGWHTYWLHPGDVGLPPSIEWDLPEGISASPLVFPAPKRVKMGQIGAHGHQDETLFLTRISISESYRPAEQLSLKAKIAWLCCSKTCLPGFANLQLILPVGTEVTTDEKWSKAFVNFRDQLPKSPPSGWEAKAYDEGGKFRLVLPTEVTGTSPGLYFFSEGRSVRSNAMQPVREKNGFWELQMTRSAWSSKDETRLRGLLYRKYGWGEDPDRKFYLLDLPLQKI